MTFENLPEGLPQVLHLLLAHLVQLEHLRHVVDNLRHLRSIQAPQPTVKIERLLHGQVLGQVVELRTEAEAASGLGALLHCVVAVYVGLAAGGRQLACQDLEGGCFASAVQAEQAEALLRRYAESQVVHGQELGLALDEQLGQAADDERLAGRLHRQVAVLHAVDLSLDVHFNLSSQ